MTEKRDQINIRPGTRAPEDELDGVAIDPSDSRDLDTIRKALAETRRQRSPESTTSFDPIEAIVMGGSEAAAGEEMLRIARQRVEQAHSEADTSQNPDQK